MSGQIKEKVKLNKVTHSVRAMQAVLQYGVGAMVDFPDQTLVTMAPEFWENPIIINDERFAKALGVRYFVLPTEVAYARFPEWYFCPKCRRFQPLKKWVQEYKTKNKGKRILEWDPHMIKSMKCSKCNQDLVVSRIVTVCEEGHLNDFPWIEWVHAKSNKQICGNPELQFKTGASGNEGLDGLNVSCSCGAHATLQGAFDKECFKKLDEELKLPANTFRCKGKHPQKNETDNCKLYPRTVQRGSSSVYFPLVYSSLVIPPYANYINTKIENSSEYVKCINIIEFIEKEMPNMKYEKISKNLCGWAESIAKEIGANTEDVELILRRKWIENSDTDTQDVSGIQYRIDEYGALLGEVSSSSGNLGDFSREDMDISEYNLPHIKSVSLIDKVRVVNSLVGFSRITPVSSINDQGFVSIKSPEKQYYPAYEVRGEGIFIEFDENEIEEWISKNPLITKRVEKINYNYNNSFIGQNHPKNITPKLIMLHTFSHLLIKQLSFECGYSVASLSERIYCSEESDGRKMSGVFIYTASGDSEGTLGGLVRQGRPDALPKIIKKAISSAKTCSNDPVCILSNGQGRDALNLAACHSCVLLPETCCEEKNGFLDRALIIGTYENPQIGFWSDIL